MSKKKPLHMRPFPFIFSLIILFTGISCKKTNDNKLTGNWRLATTYMPGSIQMTLRSDHTYEMRYKDTVTAEGTYHVDFQANPVQPLLYFDRDAYGYDIRFNQDTLLLAYTGVYLMNQLPPTYKYVRM